MSSLLYTIGHSDHPLDGFLALLHEHGISAIADVRSQPYSRRHPQFNRDPLKAALRDVGIHYVFLGRECGARTDDPTCYEGGKVQYERLAQTAPFQAGLARIHAGMKTFRLALMCAERDPLTCHRTILVSRALVEQGLQVQHVLADGVLEAHAQSLTRLRQQLGLQQPDLFCGDAELEAIAYREQGQRIAYTREAAAVPSPSVKESRP